MTQPTRAARVTWLEKIRKEQGGEFAEVVEEEVKAKWKKPSVKLTGEDGNVQI